MHQKHIIVKYRNLMYISEVIAGTEYLTTQTTSMQHEKLSLSPLGISVPGLLAVMLREFRVESF